MSSFMSLNGIILGILLAAGTFLNPAADRNKTCDFEQKLETGIIAFYQGNWKEARTIFESLEKQDEADPRPRFFNAMIPFWKYFFGGEQPDAARRFLEKSEKAVRIAEERMQSVSDDTTTVLMLGGLYGYRSLVAAGEGHYRTAFRSGTNGYSYTRKLMRMDDGNPDALIGQGVFKYMMGTIPKGARWLTNLAGFQGDKETGLDKLEEAAEINTNTRTDARMILTYLYHREEQYDDALRIVSMLVEEWPENLIFRYYYALSLEKSGNTVQAEKLYREVISANHDELQHLQEISRNRLNELAESTSL